MASSMLSVGFWARVAAAAYLLATIKTLPGVPTLRFYWMSYRNLLLKYRLFKRNGNLNTHGIASKNNSLAVFEYTSVYRTYVSPLEVDMYNHKSNSTYFADLDIARGKLLVTVFQKFFLEAYDNTHGEYANKGLGNFPIVPVGHVQALFRKEMFIFQRYEIHSRIMAWDKKWLYVILKFVRRDKKGEILCAVTLTKYVLKKKSRMTIPPQLAVEASALFNEDVEVKNAENLAIVERNQMDEIEKYAAGF